MSATRLAEPQFRVIRHARNRPADERILPETPSSDARLAIAPTAFDRIPMHATARGMNHAAILQMQQTHGNRHVQRLLPSDSSIRRRSDRSRGKRQAARRLAFAPSAPATAAVMLPIQRWWDDEEASASEESGSSVSDWVGEQASEAADWAGEQAGAAAEWAGETAGGAIDWASEQAGAAVDWASETAGAAVDWAGEQAGEALDWVHKTVGSAWDEVEEGAGWDDAEESSQEAFSWPWIQEYRFDRGASPVYLNHEDGKQDLDTGWDRDPAATGLLSADATLAGAVLVLYLPVSAPWFARFSPSWAARPRPTGVATRATRSSAASPPSSCRCTSGTDGTG